MKGLLILVMTLLLVFTSCTRLDYTLKDIPRDIGAKTSPTEKTVAETVKGESQQTNTNAWDDNSEGDMPNASNTEVSDVVRYWLLKNYQDAAEVNSDVAGSITRFANYSDMKYKQSYDDHAEWDCMVLINSEEHDHYAQYIYTGKWAKYGSVQIIGGTLSEDKRNIDGQIMILGKRMGFEQMLNDKEFTLKFPLGLNLGGKISSWYIFAVTTVDIENWADFAAHDTGYIPYEAYDLIETIGAMDDSDRSEYYEKIAEEYIGNGISIASDEDILIICGYAIPLEGKMVVAYAKKP